MLTDPIHYFKQVSDSIKDCNHVYELFTRKKKEEEAIIVKNLTLGTPISEKEIETYSDWQSLNADQAENFKETKSSIIANLQDQMSKEFDGGSELI